jgi:hypothetical protein
MPEKNQGYWQFIALFYVMIINTMYWMKNQSRQENVIYLAVWGILFLAPLLSYYVRTANDATISFDWTEIMMVWQHFGLYLLLFVIHNFLLAPLLIHQHKRLLYFSAVAVIVVGFATWQFTHHPRRFHDRKPPMEMRGDHPMMDEEHRPPQFGGSDDMPPKPHEGRHDFKPHKQQRHVMMGEREIAAVIVLVLMFAANLGIKNYIRTRSDHKRLLALEKENLEQQLEYLKYQINPHFFMNTLNNIHALVDIDPEKAKDTILELSKMMRFVLYEGDKKGVPLSREFDFIRNYITLMKLRYTDKVSIVIDLPAEVPDKQIPPLMLITFIENAFKHGISYQHPSFIDVRVTLSDPSAPASRLSFTCRNSKADKPNEEKGGVGLKNVKQRLNLLYDNNYTLNIKDETDVYNVELTIPLT